MVPRMLGVPLVVLAIAGCDLFAPVQGCTDRGALNYDAVAEEDDGSCTYSKVIFYQAVPGAEATVTVDGAIVGSVNAFYPSGPGNCSAPGNAYHQLTDGDLHDWNAQAGFALSSGTVRASSAHDCIRIRVF